MDNYFGINLKYLRKKLNITQLEIAKIINKERSIVGFYEKGQTSPTLDNIIVLSDYFGISVDDLLKSDLENVYLDVPLNVHLNKKIKGSEESNYKHKVKPITVNEESTQYNGTCESCKEKERVIAALTDQVKNLTQTVEDLRHDKEDCKEMLKAATLKNSESEDSRKRNSA